MILSVVFVVLGTGLVTGVVSTAGPTFHAEQLIELGKSLQDIAAPPSEEDEDGEGEKNWPSPYDYGFIVVSTCRAFLDEYAKRSSNFTKCLVQNARPFRFCESCVVPYKQASTLFNDMITDSSCSKALLMADRVQIVRLVNTNMENIWQSAYCPDCFASIREDNNATVNTTLTNNTIHFFHLFTNMTKCLNNTLQELDGVRDDGNISYCDKCKTEYQSLNNHFTTMLDESSSQVCMDVVDMMNYTRLKWSKDLHCSHREGTVGPVVAITCVISALPVVFYLANRFCPQNSERKTILVQRRLKLPQQATSSYGSMNGNQPALLDSSSRSNSFRRSNSFTYS